MNEWIMKNFKVQVDDEKADFFKQLLQSLNFARYEEVDTFHEPRIYPAANFEIRSKLSDDSFYESEAREEGAKKKSQDSLSERYSSLKDVISQIDKIRTNNAE